MPGHRVAAAAPSGAGQERTAARTGPEPQRGWARRGWDGPPHHRVAGGAAGRRSRSWPGGNRPGPGGSGGHRAGLPVLGVDDGSWGLRCRGTSLWGTRRGRWTFPGVPGYLATPVPPRADGYGAARPEGVGGAGPQVPGRMGAACPARLPRGASDRPVVARAIRTSRARPPGPNGRIPHSRPAPYVAWLSVGRGTRQRLTRRLNGTDGTN